MTSPLTQTMNGMTRQWSMSMHTTGWTFDYLLQRHGWEGLDGDNGRILSIVNPGFPAAAFYLPPYGPEGTGAMLYGTPWTDLDTVGHEMMHGVTHHAVSRRTGNDSGLTQRPGCRHPPRFARFH